MGAERRMGRDGMEGRELSTQLALVMWIANHLNGLRTAWSDVLLTWSWCVEVRRGEELCLVRNEQK